MLARAAASISLRSRRRKFRLFMDAFQPDERTTVVDVGVADTGFGEGEGQALTHNFFEAMYPWRERITAAGLGELAAFRAAFPEIRCVQADGRDLPFADGEFDLGFSNAVVEHLGDRDGQEALVHELCRVAQRVYVTTPNRWFPLDVHTLLPLVHWLGNRPRDRIVGALGREDAKGMRPLGPRELRSLFPYPVRIVNTGLTLVAIGPS